MTAGSRWASNRLFTFAFLALKNPFMILQSGAKILAWSLTWPASALPHPRHVPVTLVNFLRAFRLTDTAGQTSPTERWASLIVMICGDPPTRLPLVTRKLPSGQSWGLGFLAGTDAAKASSPRPAMAVRASCLSLMLSSARVQGAVFRVPPEPAGVLRPASNFCQAVTPGESGR